MAVKPTVMQTSPDSGHSFLQALATPPPPYAAEPEVYVHPKLSQKSLEMCTELLGDENSTGGDNESAPVAAHEAIKDHEFFPARRGRRSVVLPPPLVTSAYGLELRSHREHGRLVLRAEVVPRIFLRAERADERLTLQMVSFEPSCAMADQDGEEEEVCNGRRKRRRRDYEEQEQEEERMRRSCVR